MLRAREQIRWKYTRGPSNVNSGSRVAISDHSIVRLILRLLKCQKHSNLINEPQIPLCSNHSLCIRMLVEKGKSCWRNKCEVWCVSWKIPSGARACLDSHLPLHSGREWRLWRVRSLSLQRSEQPASPHGTIYDLCLLRESLIDLIVRFGYDVRFDMMVTTVVRHVGKYGTSLASLFLNSHILLRECCNLSLHRVCTQSVQTIQSWGTSAGWENKICTAVGTQMVESRPTSVGWENN